VVVHIPTKRDSGYTVSYRSGAEEHEVEAGRLSPDHTAPSEMPPFLEDAWRLVEAATVDPVRLVKLAGGGGRCLSIWDSDDPSEVLRKASISEVRADKLAYVSGVGVRPQPKCMPPQSFVQDLMGSVGSAALGLGDQERQLAQRLLHVVTQHLAQGCVLYTEHLFEDFAHFCGITPFSHARDVRALALSCRLTDGEFAAYVHTKPTLQVLQFLAAMDVLSTSIVRVDCKRAGCTRCRTVGSSVYFIQKHGQHGVAALGAICRFTEPTWDALAWCVNLSSQTNRFNFTTTPPLQKGATERVQLTQGLALSPFCRSSSAGIFDRHRRRSSLTALRADDSECVTRYQRRNSVPTWQNEVNGRAERKVVTGPRLGSLTHFPALTGPSRVLHR